jgi:cysteinyl-tRNA synthetase
MHSLHLQTQNGKMSKSKGEFLTLSLLEEKGYSPLEYRFFCLLSHYRKNLVFDYESLENAQRAYNKLRQKTSKLSEEGDIQPEKIKEYKNKFLAVLNNDLNTSLAITGIYDLLKDSEVTNATKRKILAEIDEVLSLDLLVPMQAEILISDEEILALIEQRKVAKANKNYAEADSIRSKLLEKNVMLKDTPNGTEFERI